MKVSSTIMLVLAALLLMAVPVAAQEAPEMPPVLQEQLGQMDGCTVVQTTQAYDVETCLLNCGSIHPNKVATHYKRQMDNNGFTNTSLGAGGGGAMATGEKNESMASALAKKEGSVTNLMLTVDNIEALGGTPVDPDAAQAEGDTGGDMADEPATGEPMNEEPMAETGQTEGKADTQADTQIGTQAEDGGPIGQGLAAELWEYFTPRPGDTLLEEMVLQNHPVAIFATDGPIEAVLDYYRDALLNQGWMKVSQMADADGGIVIMVTQGMQLQVICEHDLHPDNAGLGYSIMLAKINQ